jgi:hydroxyacylglutathione hydrolase
MKLTDHLYYYPEYGMLDSNTYVIKDHINIIIDIGSLQYLQNLIKDLKRDGINPEELKVILNTHFHLDHYMANEEFKKLFGSKILAHPLQKKFYNTTVNESSRAFGIQPVPYIEDDIIDVAEIKKGNLQLEIIPVPGHSEDSICIYSKKEKFLISGDVIFNENTGRVDLPGGNAEQLKHSIDLLSKMDIQYLLPGHMDIVKGADAVKNNFQFVKDNVFQWL